VGILAKPDQLVLHESILNSVQLLDINDVATCFDKALTTNLSTKAFVPMGTPMPMKPSGSKWHVRVIHGS